MWVLVSNGAYETLRRTHHTPRAVRLTGTALVALLLKVSTCNVGREAGTTALNPNCQAEPATPAFKPSSLRLEYMQAEHEHSLMSKCCHKLCLRNIVRLPWGTSHKA
jgi:hypothetical protein